MNNACAEIPPLSFPGGCSGINSQLQNTYKKHQDWGFAGIVRSSWFILRISALNHSQRREEVTLSMSETWAAHGAQGSIWLFHAGLLFTDGCAGGI